jgi:hypothetical protein
MMQCEESFVNDDSRGDLIGPKELWEKISQQLGEIRYNPDSTHAFRSRKC